MSKRDCFRGEHDMVIIRFGFSDHPDWGYLHVMRKCRYCNFMVNSRAGFLTINISKILYEILDDLNHVFNFRSDPGKARLVELGVNDVLKFIELNPEAARAYLHRILTRLDGGSEYNLNFIEGLLSDLNLPARAMDDNFDVSNKNHVFLMALKGYALEFFEKKPEAAGEVINKIKIKLREALKEI